MFDELYYIVDYRIYKNKKQYSIFFKLKAFFESTKDIFSACMEISTHQEDICHELKIGQLIAASLFNEYGKIKINYIYSCDVFRSIYDLLKKNSEPSFHLYEFPIYKILKEIGRKPNSDGSFTLKGEFSHYNVNDKNICYINTLSDEHINFENIVLIYEKFYKDKDREGNHWATYYYLVKGFSIVMEDWHDDRRSTLGRTERTTLRRVGDNLSPEEKEFLNSLR